jgi:hypothetical protein
MNEILTYDRTKLDAPEKPKKDLDETYGCYVCGRDHKTSVCPYLVTAEKLGR